LAKRGKSGPDFGPLEIRAGGLGRLLVTLVLLSPSSVNSAASHDGFDAVLGRVACGFLVLLVLLAVVRHVRWRRKGCLVRLDDAGVTLAGGHTVNWREISEVRDVRKHRGLVFVPRDGVTLPVFSIALFHLRPGTLVERMTRRWGSPLVLLPRFLDVSRDQIIDAVRQFGGGVPVFDEQAALVA
jgi:hypothetical protein